MITKDELDRAIELSGAGIDDMVTGYLACQLWAGLDLGREDESGNNRPLDENYGVDDIADTYVDSVRHEIRETVGAHPLAVRMYLSHLSTRSRVAAGFGRVDQAITSEYFGHDLYLTRERHGTGFWDRGLGELGEYLTRIAQGLGCAELLWDDGSGKLR